MKHQVPVVDQLAGSTAHMPCCGCQRTITIDAAITCRECNRKACTNCIVAGICMRCRNKTDDVSPDARDVRMTG